MSSDEDEEEFGESPHISIKGEGDHLTYVELQKEEVIVPKSLTFEEASSCLHMLGKDESGMRYAYLMITATNRKLTEISAVLQFVHVLFLDLGGNKLSLEALQVLADMPYLIFLKADLNRIESAELKRFDLLQVLNISRNKITSTLGIKQPMLECLDLNYNFIDNVLLNKEDLPNLKLLEFRGNLLHSLRGLYPPSLDSLYLAENRIVTIDEDSLHPLINLRVLHLRDNMIHKLDGFSSNLKKLKYLNLRRNQITKLRQFRKLCNLGALETLIVSQNPVAGDEKIFGEGQEEEEAEDEEMGEEDEPLDKFRVSILVILPNLKRINKKPVSAHERVAAELKRDERYKEIMDEASSVEEGVGEDYEEQSVYYGEEEYPFPPTI